MGVALSGLEMVWIYFHRASPCVIVFCPFGATHILSSKKQIWHLKKRPEKQLRMQTKMSSKFA